MTSNLSSSSSLRNTENFLAKALFNNPNYSDAFLVINGEKYHLMLIVLEKYAPVLHAEFLTVESASDIALSKSVLDPVMAHITTILDKLYQKKTLLLTIAEPAVSKEVVDDVLESMYNEKSPNVTSTNYQEYYIIGNRFGMDDLAKKCIQICKESIKIDTFLGDYHQKLVVGTNPVFLKIYQEYFCNNLQIFPKEKLMEFVREQSYETMLNLVQTLSECNFQYLVYELIDCWYKVTTDLAHVTEKAFYLYAHVKLEKISAELLVTRIKENNLIPQETYLKALEASVLTNKSIMDLDKNFHIFVLGKMTGTYENYRIITKSEALTTKFKDLFKSENIIKKGIYAIDDINGNIVCCESNPLCVLDNYWVSTNKDCNYTKGSMIRLRANLLSTVGFGNYIDAISVSGNNNPVNGTGMFVHDSIQF